MKIIIDVDGTAEVSPYGSTDGPAQEPLADAGAGIATSSAAADPSSGEVAADAGPPPQWLVEEIGRLAGLAHDDSRPITDTQDAGPGPAVTTQEEKES
ncbi:hypothetical protein ACFYE2_03750 [Kocuria sp. CPCC 205300]|uniref:hypothetical protein n=1 Tax=Kocuria sabuli TaxID=3071448 RepID=UPI0036DF77A0